MNHNEKRVRVQFDMTEEAINTIDKMCTQSSAPSRAYVVRKALGLYKRILELVNEGYKIYLEKDGEKVRIVFTDLI